MTPAGAGFSALQRAENSSIEGGRRRDGQKREFQCSSASRKFLNRLFFEQRNLEQVCFSALQRAENSSIQPAFACVSKSVRFSALQRAENSSIFDDVRPRRPHFSFSALQRAENSSICVVFRMHGYDQTFQCSSASRKFLNLRRASLPPSSRRRFSALQRAENSSIRLVNVERARLRTTFQCSSASRKFLNRGRAVLAGTPKGKGFSALQRAENSSIAASIPLARRIVKVSVLFSEPKIPQFNRFPRRRAADAPVSVLFSEPKIPQSRPSHLRPSIFPTATITLRRS